MFACQSNGVLVSPNLTPAPEKWWFDSFQYYQIFPLIQNEVYGPFFRIGGESFEPIIGVLGQAFSENHCFYSIYKPKDKEEARKLFKLPANNPCSHVHKFFITIPESCDNAQLYIGPVRGGISIQVGINSKVAELINVEIREGKIYTSLLE